MEIERPAQPRPRRVPLRNAVPMPDKQPPEPQNQKKPARKKAVRDIPKKKNTKALRDIPNAPKAKGAPDRQRPKVNFKGSGAPRPVKSPTRPVKPQTRSLKPEQRAQARAEINRKINTQTPASRQQARVNKKVGGSAKNIEIKRHTLGSKQRFYVKKKRGNLIRLLLARLTLFFIIFAVMFSTVAGLFALSLRSGGKENDDPYTLQLGADKAEEDTTDYQPERITVDGSYARVNDILYMPVSALMEYCSLTVTGTVDHLRYISRESGDQSMSFEVGSDIAYVNNTKVRMISESFISGGKLYIPLDFMLKYSQGLDITEDSSLDKVTFRRVVVGYDAATDTDIYAPLTFGLAKTQSLATVSEPAE